MSTSPSIAGTFLARLLNFAANFMANWARTHWVGRHFMDTQGLPIGLSGIIHLDAQNVLHVMR